MMEHKQPTSESRLKLLRVDERLQQSSDQILRGGAYEHD